MGIIISGITHASPSITNRLIRNPLTLFSTGLASDFLAYIYRKENIAIGNRTAAKRLNNPFSRVSNQIVEQIWDKS